MLVTVNLVGNVDNVRNVLVQISVLLVIPVRPGKFDSLFLISHFLDFCAGRR